MNEQPGKQELERRTSEEARDSNRAAGYFFIASCLAWLIVMGIVIYWIVR